MFLNWCVTRKYLNNEDFKNFKSIKQPDGLKVIITTEEMKRIEALKTDKSYLLNARELFVLSCDTGLRFSDYSRVDRQHLKVDQDGDNVLMIRQKKTSEFIEIPLTDRAYQVVCSLISGDIHAISNQKMNAYLKELCELAKIDEPFDSETWIGKNRTVEVKPKYELVSTHTGRRTFCTKLLEQGVPAQTVMEYSGHKDYKSFAKYVNIPKQTQKRSVKEALMPETKMRVA